VGRRDRYCCGGPKPHGWYERPIPIQCFIQIRILDPLVTSLRFIETVANPDGSATSHVMVKCTLADIARATNLRVEDAAFALNECGLLTKRRHRDGEEGGEEIVVSREMIEQVAKERNVKRGCMILARVLL
jgi:hypothetical protein